MSWESISKFKWCSLPRMNTNILHQWVGAMMKNNEESEDYVWLTSTNLDLKDVKERTSHIIDDMNVDPNHIKSN